MKNPSILIVEDEQIVARHIEKQLIASGYQVAACVPTGEAAISEVINKKPEIVLMDIRLQGEMDGIEAADIIRKNYQLPVIFLTSYTDDESFQRAVITEPFGYLIKPFDIKDLNRAVEMAIYKNNIHREMLDTKQRLQIAIAASRTVVWELWIEEDKLILDPSMLSQFGYKPEDFVIPRSERINFIHEEDRETVQKAVRECIEGKSGSFGIEHRAYNKDGSLRWISLRGVLLESETNKPKRLVGSATDITERKHYEEALKESEEKFRKIFESSGIGMALLRPDGQFTKVNKSFCEMLGYNEDEIIDTNFRNITHPGDLQKSFELITEMLKNESSRSRSIEKRYLRKNGELIWASTTLSLIRDSENKPLFFIAQVHDTTERKKQEEQLLSYTDELKMLNASKDKFFSIISHDLRTPFNSLLGITEFITHSYDEMSPKAIKESISSIHQSSQKVFNLILNLFEWTRLQSGKFELDKSDTGIRELIEEVVNLYKPNAIAKDIKLSASIPEDLFVYADKYMVETVLRNLVNNAIKFTRRGGSVKVSVIKKGNTAAISIEDNGVGISKENQNKLFRIDEQFKSDGTAEEKGTGLGLVLCKEFVEKNGGTISLESDEGKGSNFTFTLPLSKI
jgi:PAS domain S-box-containing protein